MTENQKARAWDAFKQASLETLTEGGPSAEIAKSMLEALHSIERKIQQSDTMHNLLLNGCDRRCTDDCPHLHQGNCPARNN